jgi:hypothetical protein
MKKILAIIPIILLFHSCDDIVYFNIPQDKKPVLENNDTICFFSNKANSIDTFIVTITDDYEIHDKKYYHEFIDIGYQKLKETSHFKRMYVQRGENVASISVGGYYFPTIYGNEKTISLDIGGIRDTSVYFIQGYNFPDTIPRYIYYSHKNGILRYDFVDEYYLKMKNK